MMAHKTLFVFGGLFWIALCVISVACHGSNCTTASIHGSVLFTDRMGVKVHSKSDSLDVGLIRVFYGNNVFRPAVVSGGTFTYDGLMPGCCYKIEILSPKGETVLGVDSTISLGNCMNFKTFYINREKDSSVIITPDSLRPVRPSPPPHR
jgi:hypothetical protein